MLFKKGDLIIDDNNENTFSVWLRDGFEVYDEEVKEPKAKRLSK